MRKLLLFFTLCLTSLGVRAYNYPGNYDPGHTADHPYVWFHGDADHVVQYLDLDENGGGLAYWLQDQNAANRAYLSNGNARTKLKVTGKLNAEDIAAMSGSDWEAFKYIDFSEATFDPAALLTELSLPSAEYILLPSGYTVSDIGSLSTTNMPNLKTAGSWDQLTGQTVPAFGETIEYTTVKVYYVKDSDPQEKYTGGQQFQCTGNEDNHEATDVVGEWYYKNCATESYPATLVSQTQYYTNDWCDNLQVTFETSELTVTNGSVTPSEFKVKLKVNRVFTYNGDPLPDNWLTVGNGIEERDGNYYLVSWYAEQKGLDANTPLTVSTTSTYYDKTTYQDVTYTGAVTEENGSYYGTITNPGNVSFPVTTTYTYSYNKNDGNGDQTFTSNEVKTTYDETTCANVALEEGYETVETPLLNQPITLENQTLNQLSVYGFVKDEANNFAEHVLSINDNGFVPGVDKLCMGGPSLGQYDLCNDSGWGLWKGTHYFDFTGATFADKTITIESQDTYNGHFESGYMMSGESKISQECETNEFYYFNQMAGVAYTCVLPTGNTEIPPKTFWNADGNAGGYGGTLQEIEIPNTYTKIGFEAFKLTKIQELIIPGSITTIEEGAFADCYLLQNVEMEASNTSCSFGEKSFATCKSLNFFTMAEGVTNLPYQMFSYCANLESIRIPSTCEVIGDFAFEACASLHSVTIPEGVEKMEHHVFRLSGLTDIYVMASSIDKVPEIYDVGQNGNNDGTFECSQLNGNGTSPNGAKNPSGSISPTNKRYFDMDTDDARALYQDEFSNGGYLGSGNCLVYFHFPDDMKWYYDAVPGFQNINGVSDAHTYDEIIAVAGTTYYYDNTGGHVWPYNTGDYFSDAYQYEDRHSEYAEGEENRTWPERTDMLFRQATGGTNKEQTYYGWRQFSLMNGVSDTGEEIFERKYDDTWYTMCFPWRMTDNQLFDTFNQKCEITEFKGAEVIKTGDYEYSLVLHFDEVAGTYYMDQQDNKYKREKDGTYDVLVQGVTISLNKYKYTLLDADGNETGTIIIRDTSDGGDNTLYDQIENIMVLAGHPYMIHPSNGAKAGSPATCYIAGVKRVAKTDEELSALETAGQVTKAATTGDAETTFTSPLGGGGNYTFHGYLGRGIEAEDYDQENDFADIPQKSYFLATKTGEIYPKYYRKMAAGTKRWTLFTAIITPDADALANIEALDGHKVTGEANVAFGEWEQVDVTAIEKIIADAEQKGEEVRQVNLNVVYNVNGQVVRTDGQIEGLPRGLYIVNGKKYMVK